MRLVYQEGLPNDMFFFLSFQSFQSTRGDGPKSIQNIHCLIRQPIIITVLIFLEKDKRQMLLFL